MTPNPEKKPEAQAEAARADSVQRPCSVASPASQDTDSWDYDNDGEDEPCCPECGGDGMVEYLEAGPTVWGEDCPSEENHLVTCPNCKGSGQLKDCSWC